MKQVYVLLSAVVACVAAEAPLGHQYLPPGGVQYAPRPPAPSGLYGAPGPRAFAAQVSAPRPFSAAGPAGPSYLPPRPAAVAPKPVYGVPAGGRSATTEDPYYEPANYDFSYMVQDAASFTDFGHQETRKDESAHGMYRVLLPDGRVQVVSYTADQTGYHPTVTYEQSGRAAPAPGFGSDGYRY